MSGKLRHNNTCENCGYSVDKSYCSQCGQKNTETRQPFHHLFTHFVEDLTHYDGAFWKTIKHLLFSPGRLTKEYLAGKRQTYVPPVKLYIFISFVTFLILSSTSMKIGEGNTVVIQGQSETNRSIDSKNSPKTDNLFGYKSVRELDSLQNYGPEEDRVPSIIYKAIRGSLIAKEKGIKNEDLFKQGLQLVPKVLFIYMPVFALWLWLFHSKRNWYFFDHGIFTLHYFSMLLLLFLARGLLGEMLLWIFGDTLGASVSSILRPLVFLYALIYFFIAHKRIYGERSIISIIKTLFLAFINMFFIIIAILGTLVYLFTGIH